MYRSYSGLPGFLILMAIVLFIFWIMFTIGGFLLGTPVGLVILTYLVVRHFWRRNLMMKAMAQADAEWKQSMSAGFDPGLHDTTTDESIGIDRGEYSEAEDVHYKEIDE
jgi:hypothetical protein